MTLSFYLNPKVVLNLNLLKVNTMFKSFKLHCAIPVSALLLVSGCATINKSTEKEAADTNNLYRTGYVQAALEALESSFSKGSLFGSNEDAKKDTVYYLEKGTYLSNLGQSL